MQAPITSISTVLNKSEDKLSKGDGIDLIGGLEVVVHKLAMGLWHNAGLDDGEGH